MKKPKAGPHDEQHCPYLHVKKCPGCGRSCDCYNGSIERRMAQRKKEEKAKRASTLLTLRMLKKDYLSPYANSNTLRRARLWPGTSAYKKTVAVLDDFCEYVAGRIHEKGDGK